MDFRKKAKNFNNYQSILPHFVPLTDKTIYSIYITDKDIQEFLKGLDANKVDGPDQISVKIFFNFSKIILIVESNVLLSMFAILIGHI